jgi:RNA polymerase sigma-70 factor (ECF subfamily)
LLRDVVGFEAAEVGALLGDSVASVNSALQRARATLSARAPQPTDAVSLATDHESLLKRYIAAFEAYDMDALASMLHDEVVQSMPPYALWLKGPDAVRAWMLGTGAGCRGSRLVPTAANGTLAFGQYRIDPSGGHTPWALHVLELQDGKVITLTAFLDTAALFPRFGLPARL